MVILKFRDKLYKNRISVAKLKEHLATSKELNKNHFYKRIS